MRKEIPAKSPSPPSEFWADSLTREALAQRDIATLFRLVQRATGATQTHLGTAVGLSQAQVSEIMSGARRVSSVEVLARIASGLQIPVQARSTLFMGEELQPDMPLNMRNGLDSEDVARVYGMRGLIARPVWNRTIGKARTDLWLYGMAELGFALDDEVPAIIEAAADGGCAIKTLLLDPGSAYANDIDADEGSPGGTLGARIRSALARYTQMVARCGGRMGLRVYDAVPTVSIVRADDHMIVTPYLRFHVGSNSPSLELQRSSGKVFDRYASHFQTMWDRARDWKP